MWQDEDEVDQGTMVRAGTGDSGTVRAAGSLAGSLSGTARTMIEYDDDDTGTMQSRLGTMVINTDEEDEEEAGTMKRKSSHTRVEPCLETRDGRDAHFQFTAEWGSSA